MTNLTTKQRKVYSAAGAEKLDAFLVDPDQVYIIGLDTDDGPEHPLYDNRIHTKQSKEYLRNIHARGVKTPIIVRVVDDMIVCVDGRQRLRALREANTKLAAAGEETRDIPAKHEIGGADEDATVTMVTANSYTLVDGPYEQAVKAQKLLNSGRSHADVAVDLAMSTATLRNRLKLLDLPSELQKSIDKIGPMTALTLGKIEDPEDRGAALKEALASVSRSGGSKYGSNSKAKKKAKKAKAKSNGEAPPAEGPTRPSVSLLKKLVNTDAFGNLDTAVKRTFMYVLGEVEPKGIKGLRKCLAELEEA